MKDDNILVIDTGSSSIRGLLMDKFGCILAAYQHSNFMDITSDTTAEQDSCSFQNCLLSICKSAWEECRNQNIALSAICFTSQRSSVLPLTKDGKPLSKILMWYDKRSASICSSPDEDTQKTIYQLSGAKPTPTLSAPKMLWLKNNSPEIYHNAYKLVGVHDYLIYLCTENFVTDISLASRTCLLDINNAGWSKELLHIFALDSDKLCQLIKPGEIAGHVCRNFSMLTGIPEGLPVISSGGDQQCSLVGQNITKSGQAGITSGTGAYLSTLCDLPNFDSQMRTNTTISVVPGKFVLEASSMAAGSVYRWLRDTFYPGEKDYDCVNKEILMSQPGAGGLLMLPDLAGKGCPQWNASVRGSFHNIGLHHKRSDFSRAALEGICAEMKECYDVMSSLTPLASTLTTSGGLSRFSEYNQIIADMLSLCVRECMTEETTAVGAWAVAVSGLGIYESLDAALLAYESTQSGADRPKTWKPIPSNTPVYKKQEAVRASLQAASPSTQSQH